MIKNIITDFLLVSYIHNHTFIFNSLNFSVELENETNEFLIYSLIYKLQVIKPLRNAFIF